MKNEKAKFLANNYMEIFTKSIAGVQDMLDILNISHNERLEMLSILKIIESRVKRLQFTETEDDIKEIFDVNKYNKDFKKVASKIQSKPNQAYMNKMKMYIPNLKESDYPTIEGN